MKVFTHKPCDYEFSPLDVIEKDNKRFYGKDGVYYPSITTVLSEFPGKQEGLSNWREKVGVDEAAKITHVAGKRGTALHDLLELYLANKIKGDNFFIFHRPPINPDVVSMFKTIKPAVDLIDNITGLEVALYSHKYKFAGRVDVIGEYQGEPAETDEAIPLWVSLTEIPYEEMWADDCLWIPMMLKDCPFSGRYIFSGDTMVDYNLETRE